MLQDALQALKNQDIVFLELDGEKGIIGDVRSNKALEDAKKLAEINFENQCILMGDIGQLYDYVQKIPEMAWDIMDFAERPLEVVFSHGKNLPAEFCGKDGEVKLRLVKDGDLGIMLQKFGKSIFFIHDKENVLSSKVAVSFKSKSTSTLSKRIIRLELDGEIQFIKK
jgi:L-threonylcarbamoyladenylate synthase